MMLPADRLKRFEVIYAPDPPDSTGRAHALKVWALTEDEAVELCRAARSVARVVVVHELKGGRGWTLRRR